MGNASIVLTDGGNSSSGKTTMISNMRYTICFLSIDGCNRDVDSDIKAYSAVKGILLNLFIAMNLFLSSLP